MLISLYFESKEGNGKKLMVESDGWAKASWKAWQPLTRFDTEETQTINSVKTLKNLTIKEALCFGCQESQY